MQDIINKLIGTETRAGRLWLYEAFYTELTFKPEQCKASSEFDWVATYQRPLAQEVKQALGKVKNLGIEVGEDGCVTVHFQPNENFQLVERPVAEFKNTPDKVVTKPRARRSSSGASSGGQDAGGPPRSGVTAQIWEQAEEEWIDAGSPTGSELRTFRLALAKRLVAGGINKTTASVQLNKWAKTK